MVSSGAKCTSRSILKWAKNIEVDWRYIDGSQPQQDAFSESLVDCLSIERLNEQMFANLDDARRKFALGHVIPMSSGTASALI